MKTLTDDVETVIARLQLQTQQQETEWQEKERLRDQALVAFQELCQKRKQALVELQELVQRRMDEPMAKTREERRAELQLRKQTQLPQIVMPADAVRLVDKKGWINRWEFRSDVSDKLYVLAQHGIKRHWGCSCTRYRFHRECPHLRDFGLPSNEVPYEAKVGKLDQNGRMVGTYTLPEAQVDAPEEATVPKPLVRKGRVLRADDEI
jgi:hypothetical protein